MSTIDNRIVEMQFNSKQFDSGVKTSMKGIQDLKDGLNFDGSISSLERLSSAGHAFSLGGIGQGISGVSSSFSAMGAIGFTVFQNLTNSTMDFTEKLFKMATGIDQIKGGFDEYEQGLSAFQTIVANTKSSGTTIDEVKNSLAELNVYANKTVYSYGDMTKAAGMFTAQGVTLDQSMVAIKGLFNLVSLTGGSAEQANRAVVQLSQGIASGSIKAMDWMSMETAGIGGKDFQKVLIDAAKLQGVKVDEMIKKNGSFKLSLQEGWLSSDVFLKGLQMYTGDMNAEVLKGMGYTQTQIDQLLTLGQTATESATKLKSFTQVVDMLKSNIVTSWAQSFKLVIGDLDQAYEVWTYIGNTIGGILQESSDARNAFIKQWADFGGREDLFAISKDILDSLVTVLHSLASAFSQIIPPMTGQELAKLTKQFREFVDRLKINDDVAGKLSRVFKGLASVFSIVVMFVSTLAKKFSELSGKVTPTTFNLLDFLAGIGDYLVGLKDAIKLNDVFGKAFDAIANAVGTTYSAIKTFVQNGIVEFQKFHEKAAILFAKVSLAINSFTSSVEMKAGPSLKAVIQWGRDLGDTFSKIFNPLKKAGVGEATNIFDRIKERFDQIIQVGQKLLGVFKGVKKTTTEVNPVLEKTLNFLGKLGKTIQNVVYNSMMGMLDKLDKVDFSNIKFDWFFDGLNSVLTSGLILAITNFIKNGSTVFDGIKGIFKSTSGFIDTGSGVVNQFKDVLKGVRESLEAYQEKLRSEVLLKIAEAIGILAASLLVLSLIDSVKLAGALGAVSVMFIDLFGAMAGYEKVAGGTKATFNMTGAVTGMIGMAVAILLLTGAVAGLSLIDPVKLLNGMGAMSVMIGEITGTAILLAKHREDMLESGIAVAVFAVAIKILSSAVYDLGQMDLDKLAKGLVGVGVLALEIGLFMKSNNMGKLNIEKGAGLATLALAVKGLAQSVVQISLLSPEKMAQGLAGMSMILLVLVLFSRNMGDKTNMLSMSIGMAIISGSMIIFAEAIKRMGEMPIDKMLVGLLGIGGGLLAITLAMRALPADMAVKSVALAIVSGALILLSIALTNLGSMTWYEIAAGLAALAGSLGIIAIALMAMEGALPGAAAVVVVAAGLAILVPVLQALGVMPVEAIGLALGALAAIFLILGIAGYALTPVLPVLIGLGAVMALIGVAGLAVGAGMLAFASGLALLAAVGAAGAGALTLIVLTLSTLIPMIMAKIAEGIISFAGVIQKGAPTIMGALTALLLNAIGTMVIVEPQFIKALQDMFIAILDGLKVVIPKWNETALFLMDNFLTSMKNALPRMIQTGYDIILALLAGIRNNIGSIVRVVTDIITAFITALGDQSSRITVAAGQTLIKFIDALALAVEINSEGINKATDRLARAIVEGTINGIVKRNEMISKEIMKFGQKIIDWLMDSVDAHSPSRAAMKIGGHIVDGLVLGVQNNAYLAGKAMADLGESTMTGIAKAVSNIADSVNGNMDMTPTIRPVIDLTDIVAGGKQIDNLLGSKSLNVSANAGTLSSITNGMRSPLDLAIQANQNGSNPSSVVFNQNNYSPTALSRLDIYRQTRNQLTMMKGLVGNS